MDDGSKDRTAAVAQGYADRLGADVFRVLRLPQNQGKGGAVQQVRQRANRPARGRGAPLGSWHARLRLHPHMRSRVAGQRADAHAQGMLHTRGELVMFADADGASAFRCMRDLKAGLAQVARDG